MSGVTFQRGVALSSCLAGPIVVTPPMLLAWAHQPMLVLDGLPLFVAINLIASIVGLFCSMIPNAVGSVALASLGLSHSWARQPLTWAITGILLGWLIQLVVAGNSEGPWHLPYLAIVGGCCALICRFGTRWWD